MIHARREDGFVKFATFMAAGPWQDSINENIGRI